MSQPIFASNPQTPARESFHFDVPAPRPQHIERFRALYLQEKGVSLSETEAAEKLIMLLVIARYRQYEEKINRRRE